MSKKAICTIITKSYLAYARTLAETLVEHNPDVELYVLLADRLDENFDKKAEPFHLVRLEELSDQQTIEQMCFYYTPFELCCALRGALHEYMFEKTSVEYWLFLDSDIMIFGSLEPIFEELKATSILLTPHCSTFIDIKSIEVHELNLLRTGLYNAGFLGLRRTTEARTFITWFQNRLAKACFNDYASKETALRGLFVDQLWLNLVPLYFREVSFCLQPGVNLGHWNLFERALGKDTSGRITVNGQPVIFVHFSGWDINNPQNISKYASFYESFLKKPEKEIWMELSQAYRDKLLSNGYNEVASYSYTFNYFKDGESITLDVRRAYYNALIQEQAFINSPFSSYQDFKSKGYLNEHNYNHSFNLYIVKKTTNKISQFIGLVTRKLRELVTPLSY